MTSCFDFAREGTDSNTPHLRFNQGSGPAKQKTRFQAIPDGHHHNAAILEPMLAEQASHSLNAGLFLCQQPSAKPGYRKAGSSK